MPDETIQPSAPEREGITPDTAAIEGMLAQAATLQAAGSRDEARELRLAVLSMTPDEPRAILALVQEVYRADGDDARAALLPALRRLYGMVTPQRMVALSLARCEAAAGDAARAYEVVAPLLTARDDVGDHLLLVRCAVAAERYDDAIRAADATLRRMDRMAGRNRAAEDLRLDLRRLRDTAVMRRFLVRRDGNLGERAELTRALADAAHTGLDELAGEVRQILSDARIPLSTATDGPLALLAACPPEQVDRVADLANRCLAAGAVNEAIEASLKALQRAPQHEKLFTLLLHYTWQETDPDRKFPVLTELHRLRPDHRAVRFGLAQIHHDHGRPQGTFDLLHPVVGESVFPPLLLLYAQAARKLDMAEPALEVVGRLLDQSAQDGKALDARVRAEAEHLQADLVLQRYLDIRRTYPGQRMETLGGVPLVALITRLLTRGEPADLLELATQVRDQLICDGLWPSETPSEGAGAASSGARGTPSPAQMEALAALAAFAETPEADQAAAWAARLDPLLDPCPVLTEAQAQPLAAALTQARLAGRFAVATKLCEALDRMVEPECALAIARALARRGFDPEAERLFLTAVRHADGETIDPLAAYAEFLYGRNRIDAAKAVICAAARRDGQGIRQLQNLCNIAYAYPPAPEGIDLALRRLIALDPADRVARMRLAEIEDRRGNLKAVHAILSPTIQQSSFVPALILHAKAARALDMLDDAVTSLARACSLAPGDAGAKATLDDCRRLQWARLPPDKRAATQLSTGETPVSAARALISSGMHDEAHAVLDGVLRADSTNLDALSLQAELDLRVGRPDRTIVHLKRCVQIVPSDNRSARAALWARIGDAHAATLQVAAAGDAYRTSLALAADPDVAARLVNLLAQSGDLPALASALAGQEGSSPQPDPAAAAQFARLSTPTPIHAVPETLFPYLQRRVFDCFEFTGDLDLLELRLGTLNEVVNQFVVVEFCQDDAGNPRPPRFPTDDPRFAPLLERVHYVPVTAGPKPPVPQFGAGPWRRNLWLELLAPLAHDQDIVVISRAGDVVRPSIVNEVMWRHLQGVAPLLMDVHKYFLNYRALRHSGSLTTGAAIGRFAAWCNLTPDWVAKVALGTIPGQLETALRHAGWSFNALGDAGPVAQAARLAVADGLLPAVLKDCLEEKAILRARARILGGTDASLRYAAMSLESDFPAYLMQHRERFAPLLLEPDHVRLSIVCSLLQSDREVGRDPAAVGSTDPMLWLREIEA